MPIVQVEPTSSRGKIDARRHRDKQREAIKKRLPEIISQEAIITKKKSGIVKIPIKSIDIPRFRPRRDKNGAGIGQGPGQPGDVIGKRPGQTGKPGAPGQEPGVDYIETEISIEELIEMMLEDLGLPRLENKNVKEMIVELGYRIAGIQKAGPWVLLDKQETVRQAIRRFWFVLRAFEQEFGLDELTCFRALKDAKGNAKDAFEILASGKEIKDASVTVEPFPVFASEDLRFRKIKPNIEFRSRAVVIAMMDVSGSMTEMKKYLARSMIFWLVSFLRHLYEAVEVRFITHTTTAKIVDEDLFFKTGEGGGTSCYTAYELARGLIKSEYPLESWNVYVCHFSDGEDFDTERTCEEAKKLIDLGINMLGYGEIQPVEEEDESSSSSSKTAFQESTLWSAFKKYFSLDEIGETKNKKSQVRMLTSGRIPFLATFISSRKHILPSLKEFLKKDRWKEVIL